MDAAATGRLRLRSLEFFLTDRCNLRCLNCSASSPFLRDSNRPELATFQRSLDALEPVLIADQIKFLGGEPLLNSEICEFLHAAATSGVVGLVRVATNGTLLHRMPNRFWELADVVEVSLYPGADQPEEEELREVAARAAEAGTVLEVHRIGRFMRAITPHPHPDQATSERVFRNCAEAHEWSCHLLYGGRLYRCSRVHTIDRYLAELGVSHLPFAEADGVRVEGRPPEALRADVEAYLTSAVPLQACRFCLGTSGPWEDCRQMSPAEVRAERSRGSDGPQVVQLVSEAEARARARVWSWEDAKRRGIIPS